MFSPGRRSLPHQGTECMRAVDGVVMAEVEEVECWGCSLGKGGPWNGQGLRGDAMMSDGGEWGWQC